MNIILKQPIGYSHIGRKDQQEDAVWPLFKDVTGDNRCIVLCDGVGGSEHGEIASQTSSRVIGEYLSNVIAKRNYVSDEDVQKAVNLAYDELERIDKDNADGRRVSMATTLTCVCFHKEGVLAAHMGDSRIYHVRPGKGLLYQSVDHSLVNVLLQAGELTVEEAKNFPRKNVITKAIQPHSGKRLSAEVKQLSDIRSGDYFFLCCDGVLEQLTVGRLFQILSMNCSDEEKLKLLEAESTDKTKDNYTAYLIPIDNIEGANSSNDDDDISCDVMEVEIVKCETKTTIPYPLSVSQQRKDFSFMQMPSQSKRKSKVLPTVVAIVLVALMTSFLVNFFSDRTKKNSNEIKCTTEQVDTIKYNLSNKKTK